jgi:hypothetical protein
LEQDMAGRHAIDFDPCYDAVDDSEVTDLLIGAVDLHLHPAPSPFPRRMTLLSGVTQAAEAGFQAVIVKSHHHSMVTDLLAVSDAVDGLPIPAYSGVALNNQVGGLNISAVGLALQMGGRIVWFPTISSGQHIEAHSGDLKFPTTARAYRPNTQTAVLDDNGKLLPAAREILAMIKEYDAILSGGHMSVPELDAVIRAAAAIRIEKIIVSHPNFVIHAAPEICAEWTQFGVKFEHELCMYDDRSSFYHWELDVLLNYLDVTGIEHTMIGSDLGQANNPLPVQAYRRLVRGLLDRRVSTKDITTLISRNPASFLGL